MNFYCVQPISRVRDIICHTCLPLPSLVSLLSGAMISFLEITSPIVCRLVCITSRVPIPRYRSHGDDLLSPPLSTAREQRRDLSSTHLMLSRERVK